MKYFILFFILFCFNPARASLSSDSLLLVHTSQHYHTSPETIQFTNLMVQSFLAKNKPVIGLAQVNIKEDPLWYTDRNIESYYSHAGESSLSPNNQINFKITFVGGYHSACLGRALSEQIAKFLENSQSQTLEVRLPMKGIFTGFFFKNQKLNPTPEQESKADSSLDGLNLNEATSKMTDSEWLRFIEESLRWAIYTKAPLSRRDLSQVQFEIYRKGRLLKVDPGSSQIVRLYYD